MTDRLAGKVALVTGAASGIGHATARLLASEGANVVALDIADGDYGDARIDALRLDVGDAVAWGEVVDQVLSRLGQIDVLVNNAGIPGTLLPLLEETLEGWNRVIGVNQTGVFHGMRAVLPSMIDRGFGSIVNISSAWGIVAAGMAVSYQTSKGAVRHLTKNAAVTYARRGIRVNSIHPGMIDTPAVQAEGNAMDALTGATPLGRIGVPIDVARGVLYLASDESSFVTGSELVIDGGFTAV
jgi:NAD(P)-dependent dehydrogenase (short-subunit alcohol dehydrogenase family)